MSIGLERCDGPECPWCGCQDAEILSEPDPGLGTKSWWGSGLARCNFVDCRAQFHFKEESNQQSAVSDQQPEGPKEDNNQHSAINIQHSGGVAYQTTACPNCRSTKTRVTSSPRPIGETKIRRHVCGDCGEKFKSYQKAGLDGNAE